MRVEEISSEICAVTDSLVQGMSAESFCANARVLCELARDGIFELSEQYEVGRSGAQKLAVAMDASRCKIRAVLATFDAKAISGEECELILHFAQNIEDRAVDASDLASGKAFA